MRGSRLTLLAVAASVVCAVMATSPVAAAGVPTIVRHLITDRKIIALTFDDGWSPSRALEIVAILDQYGATATFFPYANAVDDSPATWRTIAKRFPIGDHSTTHPNLTRLSASQIFWEIDNARQVIEGIIGRPMARLFRPPYMFFNQTVEEQAYAAGFKTMALWSVDTADAMGKDAQTIYSRAIKGTPGGIILMHAGPKPTVDALPRILDYYRSQGYSFVTVPELIGMPWSPDTTDGGGSGGGNGGGGQEEPLPGPADISAFRAAPD